MIEFDNIDVSGIRAAVRGMRNPMNSWDKSDGFYCDDGNCGRCVLSESTDKCSMINPHDYCIGEEDLKLMQKLANAGTDHSKFLRMITVTCDITAPIYWVSEHDTYKVGTVRNSCSFMHKGVSKTFEITDFSIEDERVYKILSPTKAKASPLLYSYETDDYKIYVTNTKKKYKVYRNGRIFRERFETNEASGRKRVFEEKEVMPSINKGGYYEINIGGRGGERWLLHRLVAYCWIINPENLETVNHIDGNKGNNCIENLEWLSREDNVKDAYENGYYDDRDKIGYVAWKNGFSVLDPLTRINLKKDYSSGMTTGEIAEKYDITYKQANNLTMSHASENESLYLLCLTWERTLETLNKLRLEYLETKDDEIFKAIRQILPMGYNVRYTWQANYQVLRNIRNSDRKTHRLDEWRIGFMNFIDSLPYAKELLIKGDTSERTGE